jgi:hypothetical protein
MIVAQAWLLFFIGSLLILPGMIIGVAGSRTNRRRFRYPSVLLLLIGTLLLMSALAGAALTADLRLITTILIFGGLISIVGLIALIFESRRKAAVKQGGLIMAIGLLMSVGSVILPILPEQLQPLRYHTPTPTAIIPSRTPAPTRTLAITFTSSPQPSATLSASPLPTLTHTPDFIANNSITTLQSNIGTERPSTIMTRTPTPVICTVRPFRNVNLRENPDVESILLTTIPFDTPLEATAQTKDWWQVSYNGKNGWIIKTFVNPDSGCTTLQSIPQ